MKKPVTYGAHRILHDLFKNGVTFKRALHREKFLELKERGYVATYANNLVYLTPTGQQYAIESFVGESLLASEYYARATEPADNAGPYEAELCGNSIEQETLSSVLVHFLPTTNLDKASEHAVKLASAVKASFAELDRATGGYVISQCGSAFIASGKITAEGISASTIKPGADGEEKQTSTITVKINVDASEAMKSLDELGSMAKKIDAIVAEARQQNGSIFTAINQRERDAASRDCLSARVSVLENVVNSHSAEIHGLNLHVLSLSRGK
ncbi:hypothetical protein [Klebsiella michiganensis]|uniref:hypothetical protein n=1 Tax=Klebsiella michiganensis TaxID=1134687 RepID=UPI0012BA1FEA|nr:hypothetical protein [Klebsiella michiganensis]